MRHGAGTRKQDELWRLPRLKGKAGGEGNGSWMGTGDGNGDRTAARGCGEAKHLTKCSLSLLVPPTIQQHLAEALADGLQHARAPGCQGKSRGHRPTDRSLHIAGGHQRREEGGWVGAPA